MMMSLEEGGKTKKLLVLIFLILLLVGVGLAVWLSSNNEIEIQLSDDDNENPGTLTENESGPQNTETPSTTSTTSTENPQTPTSTVSPTTTPTPPAGNILQRDPRLREDGLPEDPRNNPLAPPPAQSPTPSPTIQEQNHLTIEDEPTINSQPVFPHIPTTDNQVLASIEIKRGGCFPTACEPETRVFYYNGRYEKNGVAHASLTADERMELVHNVDNANYALFMQRQPSPGNVNNSYGCFRGINSLETIYTFYEESNEHVLNVCDHEVFPTEEPFTTIDRLFRTYP